MSTSNKNTAFTPITPVIDNSVEQPVTVEEPINTSSVGELLGNEVDDMLRELVDHKPYGEVDNDTLSDWADNSSLLYSGYNTLNGDDGDNILHGGDSKNILNGHGGNDMLSGGFSNDWLDGGDGNDKLDGGDGDDILYGYLGDDTLIGGAGKDTFLFGKKSGHDVIIDFSPGQDKLYLTHGLTYDDLLTRAVQRDKDVIINFDDENSLTLNDTHLSSLMPDSFILL